MPSQVSTSKADQPNLRISHAPPPVADARPALSGIAKGVATVQRRKEERRTDKLEQIRAQIADGTLIVRQITAAEDKTGSPAARHRI